MERGLGSVPVSVTRVPLLAELLGTAANAIGDSFEAVAGVAGCEGSSPPDKRSCPQTTVFGQPEQPESAATAQGLAGAVIAELLRKTKLGRQTLSLRGANRKPGKQDVNSTRFQELTESLQ